MQFKIHESNLDRLQKKMVRIRTKCEKYGCDFVYDEVGEEFVEGKDEYGNKSIDRYVIVECEGTAKINGWKFLATVNHTSEGNIIRKMMDGVEVPERYYTADPECEHCHSRRHRKDTYIVYNEDTGEFKQVGSSCLCDFTHGFSAEAAASYISLFDSLMEFEAPMSGCRTGIWVETREVLRYAVDFVNNLGYVPTTDSFGYYNEKSTKNLVSAAVAGTRYDRKDVKNYWAKYGDHHLDAEVTEEVETILQYFSSIEADNNYLHNLKLLASSEYISAKNLGYAVSMVAVHRRNLEVESAKKLREDINANN